MFEFIKMNITIILLIFEIIIITATIRTKKIARKYIFAFINLFVVVLLSTIADEFGHNGSWGDIIVRMYAAIIMLIFLIQMISIIIFHIFSKKKNN